MRGLKKKQKGKLESSAKSRKLQKKQNGIPEQKNSTGESKNSINGMLPLDSV